jgi:hypothetical protein
VNLLDKLGVEKSKIQLDSLSFKGFDSEGNKLLGVINFSITIGVVTFQTMTHGMPSNLSCNNLLG